MEFLGNGGPGGYEGWVNEYEAQAAAEEGFDSGPLEYPGDVEPIDDADFDSEEISAAIKDVNGEELTEEEKVIEFVRDYLEGNGPIEMSQEELDGLGHCLESFPPRIFGRDGRPAMNHWMDEDPEMAETYLEMMENGDLDGGRNSENSR